MNKKNIKKMKKRLNNNHEAISSGWVNLYYSLKQDKCCLELDMMEGRIPPIRMAIRKGKRYFFTEQTNYPNTTSSLWDDMVCLGKFHKSELKYF